MEPSASETANRRIGKYELLGELGHGGMAVVYRARDTQLLRDVAVKVLHPHLANDPESRQRFLREAQAAARLRHPNIVEVFDFSVESDRESFMVSELLEGPTLRRFAEQHPGMPAEVAAIVGIVLCDALACAHAQGVIHRDVKPDNILLARGGSLKLTDFGIAHVADSNAMTVTGQVLGSPAHMAPEQIEGRKIDARADLFALGTVLYVLSVGRLPFDAPHPHALLRKILESDYPDPLRVAPAVGHRFAAIVRKCLERKTEDRYADAGELRAALVAFVAEVGLDAPEASLKRYLADPEAFCAEHREALLAKLPDLGLAARRAGNLPDALGYFNRALALDPGNVRVLGMVRGISRRRRAKRVVTAGALVAAVAALTALAVVAGVRRARTLQARTAAAAAAARPSVRPDPQTHRRARVELPLDAGVPPRANPVVTAVADAATNARAGIPASADAAAPERRVAVVANPRQQNHANARVVGRPVPNADAGAPQAAAPAMQHVRLVFSPPGTVDLSIDGARPSAFHSGTELDLPVGTHTFRAAPRSGNCRTGEWQRMIQPRRALLVLVLSLPCTVHPGDQDESRAAAP